MNTPVQVDTRVVTSSRLALVFAVLFVAYQSAEGVGGRLLHSVAVNAVLIVMVLPVAWLCGRALGFRGLDAWYMGRSRGWLGLCAATFGLAVLAKATALAVGTRLGVYNITPAGLSGLQLLLAALVTVPYTFFPSVAEDIVTRGFLMRAFPRLAQRWLFIVASAALFVLNHIYRLSNGPVEWLMLFGFGLAYAAGLYYSRSLWGAIGLHWGWNFAGQFADRVASVDALVPPSGPMMSVAAHLVMLGLIVLVAHWRRAGLHAMLQS